MLAFLRKSDADTKTDAAVNSVVIHTIGIDHGIDDPIVRSSVKSATLH